jgi:hypothetical protein
MKAITVTLDGENEYSGFSAGNTWNGFECPLFEKSVAEEILEDGLVLALGGWMYNGKLDAFYTEDEEFIGEPHYIDGEVKQLYPIGAFSWVWQRVE